MNLRQLGSTLAIFAVTWAIFVASPIHPLTDSRYGTLVSEAMLRRGSLSLDPWFSARKELPYQVEAMGGHVYSW